MLETLGEPLRACMSNFGSAERIDNVLYLTITRRAPVHYLRSAAGAHCRGYMLCREQVPLLYTGTDHYSMRVGGDWTI